MDERDELIASLESDKSALEIELREERRRRIAAEEQLERRNQADANRDAVITELVVSRNGLLNRSDRAREVLESVGIDEATESVPAEPVRNALGHLRRKESGSLELTPEPEPEPTPDPEPTNDGEEPA